MFIFINLYLGGTKKAIFVSLDYQCSCLQVLNQFCEEAFQEKSLNFF